MIDKNMSVTIPKDKAQGLTLGETITISGTGVIEELDSYEMAELANGPPGSKKPKKEPPAARVRIKLSGPPSIKSKGAARKAFDRATEEGEEGKE